MAIKLEMLRSFTIVAETGNLADAANRLGRTQSAVSMTLSQLESHLGQKLFQGERKNRLSPFGEQVFALAQKELRQFDQTVESIQTLAQSPGGLLRIVSIPSVAAILLPETIERFARKNPTLRIEVRDTDSLQVADALLHGQADIGISSGTVSLNGITRVPLFSDLFGLVCAPQNQLARQEEDPLMSDVLAAGFVMNSLCRLIEAPQFQVGAAEAQVTVHNTLSLLAMVRRQNWVTILPRMVERIMPQDLVFREIADLEEVRTVHLMIRNDSPYADLAQDFADIIQAFDW